MRPADFIDGPARCGYIHGFGPNERDHTLDISRADVARFLLEQVRAAPIFMRRRDLPTPTRPDGRLRVPGPAGKDWDRVRGKYFRFSD